MDRCRVRARLCACLVEQAVTWLEWKEVATALSYIGLGSLGVCLGIVLEKWDRRQRGT